MLRKLCDQDETLTIGSGVGITIPVGTHVQFRVHGYEPLSAIRVTMPPWSGAGEAYFVEGKWKATVKHRGF